MKFSIMSLGLMAVSALAAPMPTMINVKRAGLAKRAASLEDVATTGYATLNGGTTGGKGGATVEVSSLSELTAAVKGDAASIVLITGPITGSGENVKIGSNKSVIGKDSSVGTWCPIKIASDEVPELTWYFAVLTGFTLTAKNVKNVIIRNLAIAKVAGGDAIAIQVAQNVRSNPIPIPTHTP